MKIKIETYNSDAFEINHKYETNTIQIQPKSFR